MHLFTHHITNWSKWGHTFQSIPAFEKLVAHIFHKEGLPLAPMENLTPGTNAVFKVGQYVIKIFAPPTFGQGFGTDMDIELFGMRWAQAQQVPAPRLVAHGEVADKYLFKYMIMTFIPGKLLEEIEPQLTDADKITIGKNIREITRRLNKPCENFTPIDMLGYALADKEWENEGFPASFQQERLDYLKQVTVDPGSKVYCHGDFHPGNLVVDDQLNVYLLDFADAMYAPAEYELVYILSALFCFEKPYLLGYFDGDYGVDDIVDLCMQWLPIHVWGHSTIVGHFKPVGEIDSFATLRKRLGQLVEAGGLAV